MTVLADLKTYMSRKMTFLSTDTPASKAMLAKLRRAAGKSPVDTPDVWEITLDELPDSLSGKYYSGSYHPSDAEWAVHIALTVFSVHSQGSTTSPNVEGVSLGKAVGKLSSTKDSDSTKKRFSMVMTSADLPELAHHIRGIAQLLRSDGTIGLDYVMLAQDLYLFNNTDRRKDVLFRWGEDFFRKTSKNTEDKEE